MRRFTLVVLVALLLALMVSAALVAWDLSRRPDPRRAPTVVET